MGNTSGKKKILLRKNQSSSIDGGVYGKQVKNLIFGYIREFHNNNNSNLMISISNILESPIIYLIIAFFPRKYVIYGIGYNNYGELGCGHNNIFPEYRQLNNMSLLLDNPSNIYVGYGRFMIKTVYGDLYCCGNNYRGDTGCNYIDQRNISSFEKIAHSINDVFFVDICGDGLISNHCIFLSNYPFNNIYAFGSNKKGQFGNYNLSNKKYCESNYFAKKIGDLSSFNNELIIKIKCGEYHTIFLTKIGNVYSCGDNIYGQCGFALNINYNVKKHKNKKYYRNINKINNLKNITDIAVGSYHNLCINNLNKLYGFGDNPNGQCAMSNIYADEGNDDDNDTDCVIYTPTLSPYFSLKNIGIIKIFCGNCHSAVIDTNFNAYLFGNNKYGQIGTGGDFKNYLPKPHCFNPHLNGVSSINADNNVLIDDISLGYNHSVVLSYLNEVYTFGDNEYNQCSSVNKNKKISSPHLLTRKEIGINQDTRITKILAGSDTTLIITKLE